ncbi:MAG: DUF4229 domain-containing protein [Actinomycetota bacterium]
MLLRYTLMRLLVLAACLLLLWLIGVRDPRWLLLGTAFMSVLVSFFALRGPREELARRLADRVQGRLDSDRELSEVDPQLAGDRRGSDEAAEDAEQDSAQHHSPNHQRSQGETFSGKDSPGKGSPTD